MASKYSAAVIVVVAGSTILLGKATGSNRWDLPKGGPDEHETPSAAALRELKEETGLIASISELRELGRVAYMPEKDLHLFVMHRECLDLDALICTSYFTHHKTGKQVPEICDFGLFTLDDALTKVGKSMQKIIQLLKDQPELTQPRRAAA